jgi:hypothetical protein
MCSYECDNIFISDGRQAMVSNVVYIANAWFPVGQEQDEYILKWLREKRDIIELEELGYEGPNQFHIFQFAIGDDILDVYSSWFEQMNLRHNTPQVVSKKFKAKIRNNIRLYDTTHNHNITVSSTLPFNAIDQTSEQRSQRKQGHPVNFMDVFSLFALAFGDSNEGELKRQFLCSPCVIEKEFSSYTEESRAANNTNSLDRSLERSGDATMAESILEESEGLNDQDYNTQQHSERNKKEQASMIKNLKLPIVPQSDRTLRQNNLPRHTPVPIVPPQN